MFVQRKLTTAADWLDETGIKIYTLSYDHTEVVQDAYLARLEQVKQCRDVSWSDTPSFCIFHQGEQFPYLVLAWWGNDNELFTSVSVFTGERWEEDASRFSFCLYDMEVFWFERNAYVDTMYLPNGDIDTYRATRLLQP